MQLEDGVIAATATATSSTTITFDAVAAGPFAKARTIAVFGVELVMQLVQ